MTVFISLTIYLAALVVSRNVAALGVPHLEPNLGQIRACDDFNMKMGYTGVALERKDGSHWALSGTLEVKEQLNAPLNIAVTVYKCDSENFASCKFFITHQSEGCKELDSKEGVVFNMFNATGARPQCPLEPGKYTIEQYIVEIPDDKSTEAFAISKNWDMKTEGFQGGEMIMCNYIHCSFAPKKSESFDFD